MEPIFSTPNPAQADLLEEHLSLHGIPYRVAVGPTAYDAMVPIVFYVGKADVKRARDMITVFLAQGAQGDFDHPLDIRDARTVLAAEEKKKWRRAEARFRHERRRKRWPLPLSLLGMAFLGWILGEMFQALFGEKLGVRVWPHFSMSLSISFLAVGIIFDLLERLAKKKL